MGFGAQDNSALLSELQTSGTVCTAAFDVEKRDESQIRAEPSGKLRRETECESDY